MLQNVGKTLNYSDVSLNETGNSLQYNNRMKNVRYASELNSWQSLFKAADFAQL